MKKYQEISNIILKKILYKDYPSGTKLPSINELAKKYHCSKGTIIKAYDSLVDKHIVYSKPRSGYFVADDFLRHEINSKGFDLSTGNLRMSALPLVDIKSSLNIGVEMYSDYSLELDLRGTPTLTKTLKTYLERQGIYADLNNIFLSLGVTQVMSILCDINFPNNKNIIWY